MRIYDFDLSTNLLRSILWQYNDAGNLQALIHNEAAFFDKNVKGFWRGWHDDVFNLDTANDFGLTVWAIILGVAQEVRLNALAQSRIWGFNIKNGGVVEGSNENFSRANFASSDAVLSLTTEQLRMLLKIRAMQLVSNGSAYDINRMLNRAFPGNFVFCRDNYDMTITYVFTEPPGQAVIFLLQRAQVFRPPGAVGYNIDISSSHTWGFGPYRMNFYKGNFYHFAMKF